jgi:NitT/TauT family transport system permease protein
MTQLDPFFPRQVVHASGNRWDWALLPLALTTLVLLAYGGSQMTRPYHLGDALPVTLEPWLLPY